MHAHTNFLINWPVLLQKEMWERNKPLSEEELDAMMPGEKEGYKVCVCTQRESLVEALSSTDRASFCLPTKYHSLTLLHMG